MENFFSLLKRHVDVCNSLLCIGLDPHAADLPAPATATAARDFCLRLVEETARYAAAYKPNSAFFEQFGAAGWEALKEVIEAVAAYSDRNGSVTPVILDAKRGDIDSTAQAYAKAAFETLNAHALTVSPYLGQDAIMPFTSNRERGVFLLCKTSNPGAGDLQDLPQTDGRPLYEHVAKLAQACNAQGNVGLVVGATHPEALARLRALTPDLWFLVPGVGAQGGQLETALQAGLRADGYGLLINVSRSLSRASNRTRAAADLRDEIEHIRHARRRAQPALPATKPLPSPVSALAADLLASGCVRFGQFTLKSGIVSPIYLDLRQLISYPVILQRMARAYAATLRAEGLAFNRLAGIPYAGLPIATAIALEMDRPLIYPRREAKDYGTKAVIEGAYAAGETALVIDDLATTGGAKIEAIQKLEAAGLKVRDVAVLIDREQGARETLAQAGYRLHAVCTLRQLLDAWRQSGAITATQFDSVSTFLNTDQAAAANQTAG
jgi:uridine monophosphate synthetase